MTTSVAAAVQPADVVPGSSPRAARSPFRPDIQGLRALAVVAVVLNHAKVGAFSGGFVGVDVFFVISGFLITQLLLYEAQHTGTISSMQFYGRRARRILPAATVVLVTTVLVSVGLLGFVQSSSVISDSVWSTFFAANIHFGHVGTDYFATDNPASPIQHFWSLAVEEQFYLVWPLLLLLLLGGLARWRDRRTPTAGRPEPLADGRYALPVGRILVGLGVLGGASLAYSIIVTEHDPTAAYFSTSARAWELSVGAICAVLVPAISETPAWLRAVMAWVGLAAVTWSIFHYTALTAFPGKAALLPVLGTGLMIAGGAGTITVGPKALLSRKGCQLMGDWSYSFYLWHWPFLIIAAGYLQRPLSQYETVLLLIAALGVSALTYEHVENPFRRGRLLAARPVPSVLLYPAAIVTTLVACLVAHEAVLRQIAESSTAPPISISMSPSSGEAGRRDPQGGPDPAVELVRASVVAARNGEAIPGQLTPALLDLNGDVADVGACDYENPVRTLCPRGDVRGVKSLVVFGDSHGRAWIPAIDRIAKREGYVAHYLVKPGCTAAQMVPDTGYGAFQGCLDWRLWAIGAIKSLRPDVLLVANDVPSGIIGPRGERVSGDSELASAFQIGLTKSMADLRDHVGRIVIIGDVPGVDKFPAPCLSAHGADLGDCAFPRSVRSKLNFHAARLVAAAGGYQFVNPIPWFCADDLCPSVVGSTVTYRDPEHITTEYAAQLTGPLEKALHLSSPGLAGH